MIQQGQLPKPSFIDRSFSWQLQVHRRLSARCLLPDLTECYICKTKSASRGTLIRHLADHETTKKHLMTLQMSIEDSMVITSLATHLFLFINWIFQPLSDRGWTSAFLSNFDRLCGAIQGRLGHHLRSWLRSSWQSVIIQGKSPWNTLGIEPSHRENRQWDTILFPLSYKKILMRS